MANDASFESGVSEREVMLEKIDTLTGLLVGAVQLLEDVPSTEAIAEFLRMTAAHTGDWEGILVRLGVDDAALVVEGPGCDLTLITPDIGDDDTINEANYAIMLAQSALTDPDTRAMAETRLNTMLEDIDALDEEDEENEV